MFLRTVKTFPKLLRPTSYSFTYPQAVAPFCSWKPNVPKYELRMDTSSYHMVHPIWDIKAAEKIQQTHHEPKGLRDKLAFNIVRTLRSMFDLFSGYKFGKMTENKYLLRVIFLEVIAGVPGMIGAMVRHSKSMVHLQPDGGWIHHLLEEAENERMHLFTFLDLKKPGYLFRAGILISQALFVAAYTVLYVGSPKTAHRFVGYLEEEAVKTYTNCLRELDEGKLPKWVDLPAPPSSLEYWALPKDATLRDVLLCIRADEMMHREVNHRFADLKPSQPMNEMGHIIIESVEKAVEGQIGNTAA